MTNPKITRRQIIKGAAAVGAIGAFGLPTAAFADEGNGGSEADGLIRWDLIDITPPDVRAGGDDTASSADGSTVTWTGSGTFRPSSPRAVSGGGTWATTNTTFPGSGTYRVTELISWRLAPGTLVGTAITNDHIGRLEDTRAGLATLRVKYSDGLDGVLFVSCTLKGTPASVYEGTNGSRNYIDFFKPAPNAFGPHANRTLFHAIGEGAED
jgi:TAT (twin-arginine translocation) pathway signal sequence